MIIINVTDIVVKNDMCIGCGICSSLCPANALEIEFNQNGEYNSKLTGNCLDSCSLCLDVCPFNNNKNEDQLAENIFPDYLKHDSNLGFHLNTYSAHINNDQLRLNSASGGITTWLLEQLLIEDKVDYIINVKPNKDSEKLFDFQIADNVENIRKGAGSSYYPVEMSEVINKVLYQEGRYAIVALPCFLKAIELAKEKNKKLKDRIIYSVGLVCGQLKNKNFTDYISKLAGMKDKINEVSYRNNSGDQPANNYYYYFNNNNKNNQIYWRDGISKVWTNRWFTYNSCSFCDDTFAELADVTLMDAWLPEFTSDYKGNNLLVVRNEEIDDILLSGKNNDEIKLDNIEAKKVIKSQQGVIDIKRKKLSYRLALAEENDDFTLDKRVEASGNIDFFSKKEVEYKDVMQEASKREWDKFKNNEIGFDEFENKMEKIFNRLYTWRIFRKLISLPKRVIKKVYKIIN